MKKVNKAQARKMYNNGETVTIIAHKMALNTPWHLELDINIMDDGEHGLVNGTTNFDTRVNNFEFYNCCYETGYYAAYYVKGE